MSTTDTPQRPATAIEVAATANPWVTALAAAVRDLRDGVTRWRIWGMLAINDVRQRYRRSLLGQFWLTLSMGVTIGAIGIVYSALFQQPTANYLPFLGIGLVAWALIAGIVTESCTAFVQADGFIRQMRLPLSLFVLRTILRNLIVLAHNLLIVVAIVLLFAVPLGWTLLLLVPGLLLTLVTALWVGLLFGTLCTRFRDLPQIVASFMQIAFFVTPVIYKPELLSDRLWAATHLNPFASFLSLLRDPLLGQVPEATHYWLASAVAFGGLALTIPVFARFRARIAYWL